MPTIQQENGIRAVKGLPLRWGIPAYRELHAAQGGAVGVMPERYKQLSALLDDIADAPLPLDSTEAQLCMLAERCASECMNVALDVHEASAMRVCVELIVRMHGMEPSTIKDDQQAVLRYMDAVWWRRNLRIIHGRARERAAMRLGFVSSRQGKYCSDETVKSRLGQRRRNIKVLKNTTLENVETGQKYALDELADKSTSNPKLRRGELMLRMDGVDEIAIENGHVGVFVTLTAPSAYHCVLEKTDTPNPKYNGATPSETQDYLCKLWTRTRAQNGRDGLAPYGFRVAEPHHDGCTHWHMVVFMPADDIEPFKRNLRHYALEEAGDDAGADKRRVTFKELDPSEGSAAAYMMKYIGKNIGDNEIKEDKNGRDIITKEMRVDAWAGVWGIRQFQPFGQPPVTGYREFRRVEETVIADAPEHVRAAWLACNRVDLVDEETGEIAGQQKCSWAAYIRAQGGVNRGRHYRIAVTTEKRAVTGRYGMQDRDCPTGMHCKSAPHIQYASTRYTWRRSGVAFDVALRRPWSPVNNCTEVAAPKWEQWSTMPAPIAPHDDSDWWGQVDFAVFDDADYQDFAGGPELRARALEAHAAAFDACEKYDQAYGN